MTKHFRGSAVVAGVVGLSACAEQGAPARPVRDPSTQPIAGESVYASRFTDGNTFACATCHALSEPAADGLRRVGHPIGDVAARSSFKNGQYSELRDAVNTCVTEWMLAPALEEDDPRWTALQAFLTERAPESAPAIRYQIVEPPNDLEGGDVAAGMELFNLSCSTCHGIDAKGTTQAPALYRTGLSRETIARRVRTSGPVDSATYRSLTGGRMPFWGQDRLSDGELLDLVAFVEMLGQRERPTSPGPGANGGGAMRSCPQTHARVGQSARLGLETGPTLHRVAGTVRVIDDCTLRIDRFSYDGNGIDVRVYAGRGGRFAPPVGFAISENFVDRVFDGTESFTVQLPAGMTLDDFDGVSIWCVAVGADFGHALFP